MAFFNKLARWWCAATETKSMDMDLGYFTLVSSRTVIVAVHFVA